MKKPIKLNKKTIKKLKLKLLQQNERKVAPATIMLEGEEEYWPSTGNCEPSRPIWSC